MGAILVVAEKLPPTRGGLARATARIAQGIAAGGHEVHVVALDPRVTPGARGRVERGAVVEHPVGALDDATDARLALVHHGTELARAHRVDVVIGIWALGAGVVARAIAAATSCASVVAIRGNDLDRGALDGRDLPLLALALRDATVVTAVSRDHARRAHALFGRPVVVVPNGVDTAALRPVARDLSVKRALGLDDAPVIGFSGELREKKGMRFLLPAFAELARRRPARLLLVGGVRDDEAPALASFAARAPDVMDRVHVVPWDDGPAHLSSVLAQCDVCVFPSILEGFPNAVLEAMACARPVLVSDVGGHRDLVAHGETGALFPLSALDALPALIEEMLDLPATARSTLGVRARAFVEAHHGLAHETRAWCDVIAQARARASA